MDPVPTRVTLRMVAQEARASLACVSMALRRHPNIPKETRRRIEQVAERLGYRRDAKVSELMTYLRGGKAGRYRETLGYLSSFAPGQEPAWQRQYLEGAAAHADRLGYRIDPFWIQAPGLTERRLSAVLRQRGIRGLLIAPFGRAGSRLDLDWDRFAAVAFGYTLAVPQVHRVLNHHFNTMILAVTTLTARGYRRIGLAMEPINDETVNRLWKAGYLIGQEQLAPGDRVAPFIQEFSADRFAAWFEREKLDAVIANEAKYYLALRDRGWKCPRDFALVTLTHEEAAPQRLARLDQNYRQQGVEAVNLLLANLLHHNFGLPEYPQLLMVNGRWQEGETVRSASRARRG